MGAGGAEGRQLRVGGGGPRRSENWGVLIWAFLLPQGSYWSSNHSEQGWLAGEGGGTGGGRLGRGLFSVSRYPYGCFIIIFVS